VVQLAGAAASPDGRRWLLTQPCGTLMDLAAPAAAKLGAVRGLARAIGRLASADRLHCDISHHNVLTVGGGPEVLLVDFGASRRLIPSARLDDIDDSAQACSPLPAATRCGPSAPAASGACIGELCAGLRRAELTQGSPSVPCNPLTMMALHAACPLKAAVIDVTPFN
jgi:hypothetical protein